MVLLKYVKLILVFIYRVMDNNLNFNIDKLTLLDVQLNLQNTIIDIYIHNRDLVV